MFQTVAPAKGIASILGRGGAEDEEGVSGCPSRPMLPPAGPQPGGNASV